ncbi:hypothetical protein GCM10020255_100100 [Rhodococcus baikonurensis]
MQGAPAGAEVGRERADCRQDEQRASGSGFACCALVTETLALGKQVAELGEVGRCCDVEDLGSVGFGGGCRGGGRSELSGLRFCGGADSGGLVGECNFRVVGCGGGTVVDNCLARSDNCAGCNCQNGGTALESRGRGGSR